MEGQTIGPIIRNFIKKLNELEDKPLNEQSVHIFGCLLNEMDQDLVHITHNLHKIKVYKDAEKDYNKATQELNEKWLKE